MSRRRNSSISENPLSRRSRTGSMVQEIALNVPETENRVDLDNFGSRRTVVKTKSFTAIDHLTKECGDGITGPLFSFQKPLLTFPLTQSEKDEIWMREIKNFKYDYTIDPEDEYELENIHNSDAYEFIEFLDGISAENNRMLNKSKGITETLNELLTVNEKVANETLNFQEQSDKLLSEVNRLSNLYEELSSSLTLFESLDSIVKSLNTSSSGSIVVDRSFNENILKKLDKCLAFVNDPKTAKYKEVEIYRFRFTQCMIRSLSLIKNHVINGFKSTEIVINNKIREEKTKLGEADNKSNVLSSAMSLLVDAFLYGQFPADLADLKTLIDELYARTSSSSADEFTGLLNDCYNQYFSTRSNLLNIVIKSQLELSNTKATPLGIVQLAQSNISFFVKLLEREFKLFRKLFFVKNDSQPQAAFTKNLEDGDEEYNDDDDDENSLNNNVNIAAVNHWFERLLEPLYFLLRNRIIRESNIGDLCELITILLNYSNKEGEDLENGQEEEENASLIGSTKMYQEKSSASKSIDFEKLFQPILQDAQTRLVFRTQQYVEKNIVGYQKTGKELFIGNRRQSIQSAMTQKDSDLDGDLEASSAADQSIISVDGAGSNSVSQSQSSQLIYPPIIKSVKLLTKIYQLLNQGVFDDLANSVVHLVLLSMRDNFSKLSGIEPKLYQIKNLLFFAEYIGTFEIEYVRRETNLDFSGLRNLFRRFYRGDLSKDTLEEQYGTLQTNDSVISRIMGSVPKVVDDYIDCKAELQLALRSAVHEFIQEASLIFIKPLLDYKVASEPNCQLTMEEFSKTTKNEIPRLKPIILNYVSNVQVFVYLIDGIQESVIREYEQFYSEVQSSGSRSAAEHLLEVDSIRNVWMNITREIFEDMNLNDDEFNDNISINSQDQTGFSNYSMHFKDSEISDSMANMNLTIAENEDISESDLVKT